MSGQLNCKEADIAISALGDNVVVAGVAGRPLRIKQIWLVSVGGAVNVKFKDGAAVEFNAVGMPLIAAGSAITFQNTDQAWWRTSIGNGFVINLSGAVSVMGRVYYTEG